VTRASALFSLALTACGWSPANLKPDATPSPGNAYVYGRFGIDAESALLSLDGHQSIGFEVRCREGDAHIIRFTKEDAVQMIEVPASTCQINDVLYTDVDGNVLARRLAPFRLLKNEILAPGGVYYVGDFHAGASRTAYGYLVVTEEHTWSLTDVKADYAKTTADLKARFPAFASARTENRMGFVLRR
jgi:hypothetical protein